MKIKNTPPFKIVLLLVAVIFFYSSCTQDEESVPIEENYHQDLGPVKTEEVISYSNLQLNLPQVNFENDFTALLQGEYVISIDTDRITKSTSNDETFYSLDVNTPAEDNESFTRLIYYVSNGDIKYGLVRYNPVEELNISKEIARKESFYGIQELIDSSGNVEVTSDFKRGEELDSTILNRLGTSCLITIETIIEPCYGVTCPCLDGNGMPKGWNINVSGCTNSSSSTGGTYPNNGSPNNGSSGGGSGNGNPNYGDLPTTPGGWNLFMNLLNITGPNDSFYFVENIPSNQALYFNSFNEYEAFLNNFDTHTYAPVENSDGTYTTRFIFGDLFLADLYIDVKQKLCNNASGQDYEIEQIITNLVGTKIFGMNWSTSDFRYSIEGDQATIDLFGNITYNVKTPFGDFLHTNWKHFEININIFTGFPREMYELD